MEDALMDLRTWLVTEARESRTRLQAQVLEHVPTELRGERPGGGSSINWGLFHVTTHAQLALVVLKKQGFEPEGDLREWGGLEEEEAPWSSELDPAEVESRAVDILGTIVDYLYEVPIGELDARPAYADGFERAGLDLDRFAWLVRMWAVQPTSFVVRWPLLGHIGNHIGELVAVRNRLGLSPF
jgi:hypothetical protein